MCRPTNLSFMKVPAWLRDSPNLRWLFAARILRSIAQGFLTVVIPLYIASLGLSTLAFGSILSIAALGSAAVSLGIGLFGDRYGRRPVALIITVMSVFGTAGFALVHSFAGLAAMAVLSTFGRGGGAAAGASWGPLFSAIQPMIAGSCSDEQRTSVFSGLSVIGAIAGAIGSLIATVPAILHGAGWTWVAAYRVMFWAASGLAVLNVLSLVQVREVRPQRRSIWPSRHSLSVLGRLAVTNVVNGFGMGLLGPLLTYWFYLRYHVGAAELGVLYTIANGLSVLPYLGAPALARRLGAVVTVSMSRAVSALLLLGMAICPTFLWASGVYLVRIMTALVSMPVRQSFVMGVTEEGNRSTVSAFSGLPVQLGSSVSPSIGSYLMEAWTLEAPLFLAAVFQLINSALYFGLFRHELPPEEAARAVAAAPQAGGR